MGCRRQIAHHHAEAVVERHRNAHAVLFGVSDAVTDEVAVVEDVDVRERGALGESGGTRRVLNIDRIVRAQPGLHTRQRLGVDRGVGDLLPRLPPDDDHVAQRGASPAHFVEHRCVVGTPERRRREDRAHRRLVEHVLQLVGAICGIDVHQNRADLSGGVLDHHPLGTIRRPDPDPVAGLGAAFDQRGGDPAGRFEELGIGPAAAGRALDQRLPVRKRRGRSGQVVADRLVEKRRTVRSGVVGQHAAGSLHRGFSAIAGTRHRKSDDGGAVANVNRGGSATKAGRHGRTRSRAIRPAVNS